MAEMIAVVYVAILVEGIVNIVRNIENRNTDWRYWVALFVAIGLAVFVSWNWNVDLFSKLLGEGAVPYVGAVLTGLIASRGSNYAADLLKLIKAQTVKIQNGG